MTRHARLWHDSRMKEITIHARVDRQTKLAVQKLAKDSKVTPSIIVRWALDSYLKAKQEQAA